MRQVEMWSVVRQKETVRASRKMCSGLKDSVTKSCKFISRVKHHKQRIMLASPLGCGRSDQSRLEAILAEGTLLHKSNGCVPSCSEWCRASLEPVVLMAYGKNGTMCWLAGAVRTLMKRVEMLEARDSFKDVDCNIHINTSVSRHRSDGNFETQYTSPKVQLPRHKPAADLEPGGAISADDSLQDMSMSSMHGDGFKQVLSDDDGLACVPRQKAVRELDFLDVNSPECNQVETVPFRHVSFAETLEMVEFDPAAHAALSPVIEYTLPQNIYAELIPAKKKL